MRVSVIPAVVLTVAVGLLTGCSTRSTDEAGVITFVAEVQQAVPETSAYTADLLGNIAQAVCDLGEQAAAAEVLHNFTGIPAADRDTVARLALTYACR